MDGFIILSSKAGVSIYAREFIPNFGLKTEQQQNEINLSGLIFALKLNSDFVISEPLDGKTSLSSFSFSGSTIHFYQHPTFDILCAAFTSYQSGPEDFSLGSYMAKEICTRFAAKYPKVVSSKKFIRRKFNSFDDELSGIWKEAATELMYYTQEQMFRKFGTCWMYICYSHDFQNMLDSFGMFLQSQEFNEKQTNSAQKVIPTSKAIRENQTPRYSALTTERFIEHRQIARQTSFSHRFKQIIRAIFNKNNRHIRIKFIENVVDEIQIFVQRKEGTLPKIDNISCLDSALTSFYCAGQLMSGIGESVQYMEVDLCSNDNRGQEVRIVFTRQGSLCQFFPVEAGQKEGHLKHTQQSVLYHVQPLLKHIESLIHCLDNVSKEIPISLNNLSK